ncbi:hypothetical protein GCM10027176_41720 [Actinoallomurus bryophytorum]
MGQLSKRVRPSASAGASDIGVAPIRGVATRIAGVVRSAAGVHPAISAVAVSAAAAAGTRIPDMTSATLTGDAPGAPALAPRHAATIVAACHRHVPPS